MLLVDSHCHLDTLDYVNLHQNVEEVLTKAKKRDVGLVLAVATSLLGFHQMVELIGQRKEVKFSCGVHPLHLQEEYDTQELKQLAAKPYVVALGETGLDYFYPSASIERQQASFREHIRTGRALNKPIIVHTRDAREDTLAILQQEQADQCGGVLHCFTEDKTTAKALLDLGFYLSISGIVTFRNAHELRDVVRYIPLDRLLIETDAPYLAPAPHRGKENQPAYVRDVAEYLAVLKGISLLDLAKATTENFCQLFHLNVDEMGG